MSSEQTKIFGLIGFIAAIILGVLAIDLISRQIAFWALLVGSTLCIGVSLFVTAREDTESLKAYLVGAIALIVAAGIAQLSIWEQEDSGNDNAAFTPANVVEEFTEGEIAQVVELALQADKLTADGLAEHMSLAQLASLFTELDPKDTFGGDSWTLSAATDSQPGQIMWRYSGNPFELNLPSNYFCGYWFTVTNSRENETGVGPNRIPNVTGATIFFRPTPFSPAQCQ